MTARLVPPEEPLALSAPLAWRSAPSLCRTDPDTGGSCAWSHGLWQVLRLLGLVTTPVHHAAFYREAVRRVVSSRVAGRTVRVLVSGTADYSMLAHALAAFRGAGVEPEITVLDLCETPLMLCRWYAGRTGAAIRTVRSDILDFTDEEGFDFVCTHSLLGRFAPRDRERLARRWFDLLRPGGRVATVKRIRPGSAPDVARFGAQQVERLVARALEQGPPPSLGIDADRLAAAVREYGSRTYTWPIAGAAEIGDLLKRGGLEIEELRTEPVGVAATGLAGPTIPDGAPYVQVVAVRR